MVASPQVWVVVVWQLPLNQTEATASKSAKETLRHRLWPVATGSALVYLVAGPAGSF